MKWMETPWGCCRGRKITVYLPVLFSDLERVGFIGGVGEAAFPAFTFADLKAVAVYALSAFSSASRSLRAISAEVSPAKSASS